MAKIEISVVIPCYNESKILPQSIKILEEFFSNVDNIFTYELIFVDDGSTDKTNVILYQHYMPSDNIEVVSCSRNRGKGYAVRKGIKSAKYDNILILDADLSVKPNQIFHAMTVLDMGCPVLLKSQREYTEPQTIIRIFLGWVYSIIHRFWLKTEMRDTQCPFTLMHDIRKSFADELTIDGFAYDIEILLKCRKEGIRVNKIRVPYSNNKDSRVTFKKVIRMFIDTIKLRFIL